MATIKDTNTSTTSNAKRKAAAFVNVNLVSKNDSTKTKQLGGVPLYADNTFHAQILEHLKNGGELNIETSAHIVEDTNAADFF